MKWSKLRKLVKDGFSESLAKRLDINSTAYGGCSCGHAWITMDGDVIANFCTRASANVRLDYASAKPNKMYEDQLTGYGELSRQDAYQACWDFVHSLTVKEALEDSDPLVQSLAVVDRRLGKRRLGRIDEARLHPLAKKLLEVRLDSERGGAGSL